MTVVTPSLTCTRVIARCVSIDGMLSTSRAGRSRSRRVICMITVLAAVICGVTLSVSAASLNVTVTVLLASVCTGNLHALRDLRLDVVLRRDPRRREDAALAGALERRQRDVEIEGAVDRAERETDRRVRRLGRQIDRRAGVIGRDWRARPSPAGPACPAGRRRVPEFGNARLVVLPMSGVMRPFKPHCTPIARANSRVVVMMRASISTCGSARSSVVQQLTNRRELLGQVGDDERVRPRVDLHLAVPRQAQRASQQRRGLGGLGVAERDRSRTRGRQPAPRAPPRLRRGTRALFSSSSVLMREMRTIVPSTV